MSAPTLARPVVAAFDARVLDVVPLSPSFTRVLLGGEDLAAFADCGPLGPRDLRVKLVVGGADPLREWTFDDGWYPRWLALPEADRGWMRTYTVRSVTRGAAGVVVAVDLVRHDDAPGAVPGPAARWLAGVRPGDRVTMLGPCGDLAAYRGVEWAPPPLPRTGPGPALLLAADETGVPAVASVLATLPEGYRTTVLLEVPRAGDVLDLRVPQGASLTWLPREGRPHGRALLDHAAPAVRSVARAGGPRYAWVAGEAALVRSLRRMLLRDGAFARQDVTFLGYWRQGGAL